MQGELTPNNNESVIIHRELHPCDSAKMKRMLTQFLNMTYVVPTSYILRPIMCRHDICTIFMYTRSTVVHMLHVC